MQGAIRTEQLGKTFRVGFWGRKVKAVEDLSLEVQDGEIFGLLGPNGAGKTTAIKMLLGFVRPTRGRAFVAGEPAGSLAARRTLGYLPENPALYEFLTGEEYLRFAGRLAGLSRRDAATRTERLLEQVGLSGRADRAVRRFSKGMVQRLALAQALIGDPRIVILDEPMSGLDPIGRKDVRDLILRLREQGKTVFMNTHILHDVELVCDRVAIIAGGRIRYEGTIRDFALAGERSTDLLVASTPAHLGALLEERFAAELRGVVDRIEVRVSEKHVDAALALLLQNGATVVSVSPHRVSLEQIFMSAVEESRR